MEIGATFDSWDEFSTFIKDFSEEQKVQLNVFSSKTVESGNNRIVSSAPVYPARHKYCYARLACIHYGKRRSRCTGIRANQSTFRQNCPYTILVTSDRKLGKLRISQFCLEHNHDVGEEIYRMYPAQRRLNKQEQMDARSLIDLNMSQKNLREHLQRVTGKQLTMKDVHNLKAKFMANERDCTMLFFKAIDEIKEKDPGANVNVTSKEDGTLDAVFLQTTSMKENLTKYPEILLCESRYASNKMQTPLYIMSVRDINEIHQPAAFILFSDETRSSVTNALAVFLAYHTPADDIKVLVIDRDTSEIEPIQCILPDVKVVICWSFLTKTTQQQIYKRVLGENKASISDYINGMLNATSEEVYDALYIEMSEKCGERFRSYFNTAWHPYRESWSKYWVDQYSAQGGFRMKTLSEKVKTILSGKFKFDQVLKQLVQYSKVKMDYLALSSFNQTMKRKLHETSEDYGSLTANLKKVAVDKVKEQLSVAHTTTFVMSQRDDGSFSIGKDRLNEDPQLVNQDMTECSCDHFKNLTLPCCHIIALRKHNNLPYMDPQKVGIRWKKVHPTPVIKKEHSKTLKPVELKTSSVPLLNRYQNCLTVGMQLAEVASQNEGNFDEMMLVLKHLLDTWNSGQRVTALVVDQNPITSSSAGNSSFGAASEDPISVFAMNSQHTDTSGPKILRKLAPRTVQTPAILPSPEPNVSQLLQEPEEAHSIHLEEVSCSDIDDEALIASTPKSVSLRPSAAIKCFTPPEETQQSPKKQKLSNGT